DERETGVGGQRLASRIVERDVRRARGAAVLLGSREGVLADVPAVERRARTGPRHLDHRDAGTAADVRGLGALLQALDEPGDVRESERDEHRPKPRGEAALDAAGALGAERVVREP